MKKKHKTEKRTREIFETYCADPGCLFLDKPAQSGVCYLEDPALLDLDKFDKFEKEVLEELVVMKKIEKRKYVRALEAHYICAMINWNSTLDECVQLRKQVALLKLKSK